MLSLGRQQFLFLGPCSLSTTFLFTDVTHAYKCIHMKQTNLDKDKQVVVGLYFQSHLTAL